MSHLLDDIIKLVDSDPEVGFYITKYILSNDKKLTEYYLRNDYKINSKDDPRLTSWGCILRQWSMDELPQFFNVIKGEMNLVGPRPIVPKEIERYQGIEDKFLSVKPGITGVWQINDDYEEITGFDNDGYENFENHHQDI